MDDIHAETQARHLLAAACDSIPGSSHAELLSGVRRRARRRARARAGATAGSAAAVIGGAAAVFLTGTVPAPASAPPSALPSAAHVTAQLADALQASRTDVLYDKEVQTSTGTTITRDEWLGPWDPSSGQTVDERLEFFQNCTGCKDSGLIQDWAQSGTMPAGASASDAFPWGTSVTTTGTSVNVNYPAQEWTDQKSVKVSIDLPLTPAEIQHDIAVGKARVAGNAVIDGVQTVELDISGFDGPGSSGDIYVDASSHLPVRTVVSASNNAGTQTVQDDYQFLPATPANLANLNPVIPPNFTETSTLNGPAPSNGS